MAGLTKPAAVKCVGCGGRAEPYFREAVMSTTKVQAPGVGKKASSWIDKKVVAFPAKWFQRDECETCERRRFAAEEAQERDRITKDRLRRAGLEDARLQSFEFKDYRTNTVARERVASMVRPIYSRMARSGTVNNLVLSGGAGAGKTHLAACFAKAAVMKGGFKVRFVKWPLLCLELREADLNGRKFQAVNALCEFDVVVLDDLGAEKVTEFVVENVWLILDRWETLEKSGLIVTTNLTIGEIANKYGDRVSSRLGGMSALVDFEGCPDGRIESQLEND